MGSRGETAQRTTKGSVSKHRLTGCCPSCQGGSGGPCPGAQLLHGACRFGLHVRDRLRRAHARPSPLLTGCLCALSKLPLDSFRSQQEGEPVACTFKTPLRTWHQWGRGGGTDPRHQWGPGINQGTFLAGFSVSGLRVPQKGRCVETQIEGGQDLNP